MILNSLPLPLNPYLSTHMAIRVGEEGCCLFVNTGLDSGAPGGAQVNSHINRSILYKNKNDEIINEQTSKQINSQKQE